VNTAKTGLVQALFLRFSLFFQGAFAQQILIPVNVAFGFYDPFQGRILAGINLLDIRTF